MDTNNLVGFSLTESKQILKRSQQKIVREQTQHYTKSNRCCPHCLVRRRIKGTYDIQYRTLFGIVTIPNLRLMHCQCSVHETKSFSVLNEWMTESNSPELQYIETKWASIMSYAMTVNLLKEVLPINTSLNAETIRHHLHKVVQQQDEQLSDQPPFVSGCQNTWANLPRPGKPLTVGIDGGYVRDCNDKKSNFEVIVAKSMSSTEAPKRLGFVQKLTKQPQRRLMRMLKSQGMQENQQITFLSDGADNVRNLQYLMYPEAQHVLDWFHITMRLNVLDQFTKGLRHTDPEASQTIAKDLIRAKWYPWHGNVEQALPLIEEFFLPFDNLDIGYEKRKKFGKHLAEMATYIGNNAHLISNYGERYRYGETITTSFAESAVNEIVAKRMVKKQQMQ
ncbi:MAG: hypothetical protein ACI9XK_002015 [Granulosicoccus sp.]|jgi:hypothetical protein